MIQKYKLQLQRHPGAALEPTSWQPRNWQSASALWRYYSNNFPEFKYWLTPVN